MNIALITDIFDEKHLEAVKKEMITRGAPSIHAVWIECYSHYAAIEGCHRIRAAKELGLIPEIIEVEYSNDMCSSISGYDGDDDYTISDICDDSYRSKIISFDD